MRTVISTLVSFETSERAYRMVFGAKKRLWAVAMSGSWFSVSTEMWSMALTSSTYCLVADSASVYGLLGTI